MKSIQKAIAPALLALMLCGCTLSRGATIAEVTDTRTSETAQESQADTTAAAPSAVTAPTEAATTAPTSAYEEDAVLAAYQAVLAGESFQCVDTGLPVTLDVKTQTFTDYYSGEHYSPSKFLLLDMDADSTKELLLWLRNADTSDEHAAYYVLHYNGSEVLGYSFPYGSFDSLKEDGTYIVDDSEYYSSIVRQVFTAEGHEAQTIAFYKAGTDDSGKVVLSYAEINGQEVTDAQYRDYYDRHRSEKASAVWLEYDRANLQQAGLA